MAPWAGATLPWTRLSLRQASQAALLPLPGLLLLLV